LSPDVSGRLKVAAKHYNEASYDFAMTAVKYGF
jgi:hypothetical protein